MQAVVADRHFLEHQTRQADQAVVVMDHLMLEATEHLIEVLAADLENVILQIIQVLVDLVLLLSDTNLKSYTNQL